MNISLVVAVSQNGVIGNKGKLPWNLPSDMQRFRQITMNHWVLMGRKTFESMKSRPLKWRENIVVSNTQVYAIEHVYSVKSFKQGMDLAREDDEQELMVIGGERIYEEALPFATRIYLTLVKGTFEGDTHFPKVNWNEWVHHKTDSFVADSKNPFDHEYWLLVRKQEQ